jgi:magnesium-transporting ATPase (P-type)
MGLIGFGTLFGLVLTGVPALLLGVLYAAASAALAFWTARRTPAAWWATVAFFAVMFAGSLSTFFLMDLGELYRRSGLLPEHQIAAMEPAMGSITTAVRVSGAACSAAIFACMIYMRKHFVRRNPR